MNVCNPVPPQMPNERPYFRFGWHHCFRFRRCWKSRWRPSTHFHLQGSHLWPLQIQSQWVPETCTEQEFWTFVYLSKMIKRVFLRNNIFCFIKSSKNTYFKFFNNYTFMIFNCLKKYEIPRKTSMPCTYSRPPMQMAAMPCKMLPKIMSCLGLSYDKHFSFSF